MAGIESAETTYAAATASAWTMATAAGAPPRTLLQFIRCHTANALPCASPRSSTALARFAAQAAWPRTPAALTGPQPPTRGQTSPVRLPHLQRVLSLTAAALATSKPSADPRPAKLEPLLLPYSHTLRGGVAYILLGNPERDGRSDIWCTRCCK